LNTRPSNRTWKARDLLGQKHLFSALPGLVSTAPDDSIRHAANLLQVYNLNQLPVLKEGRQVGSVSTTALLQLARELPDALDAPVQKVMEKPLETVDENADYSLIVDKFTRDSSALVVTRGTRILGVLTPVDAVAPWLAGAGEFDI
jgi:predicted transcriptional regulator